MLRYALAFLILFFISSILFSCNTSKENEKGVESAMNLYNHYIQKMEPDSIALLFTTDGNLGNIASGRDSIRNFLSNFKDFKVLSQTSITKLIKINRDSTVQQGDYHQTTIIPKNDTVKVSGTFTATWIHSKSGWHLKRMLTKPV
ncbi:MAG TPA: nuclear transport factor 2 family protein [Hanamia sp.]|nr:nuclear transport factor 2 family protein [Hanamia sp.]